MSPLEELSELYSQWRLLTERESAAIGRDLWLDVAQCQSAKSRLQPRIVEISQVLDPAEHERTFRAVVDELVRLERSNGDLLQDRRREASRDVEECDRSCRSLRHIQRLYVPPIGENWQSYS